MDFPTSTYCPYFQSSIELLGSRWTASILRVLLCGPHRFSELLDAIPRLSSRLLSQRLEELTAADMVVRDTSSLAYVLTDKGQELRGMFMALEEWNTRWHAPSRP